MMKQPAAVACLLTMFGAGASGQIVNEDFTLTASDPGTTRAFGLSLAMHGATAVIGARGDSVNGPGSGSAYVFDVSTGQELFKLTASDGAGGDNFGFGVGVGDGLAVLGARYDAENGIDSGSAYLFDTTTGQQLHKLLPDDGQAGAAFGISCDVSGGLVAVGAFFDSATVPLGGAVYIFDAANGQQLHKLVPNDIAAGDAFGTFVQIDSGVVAVGSLFSNAVYLFDAATGTQQARISPATLPPGSGFGTHLDLDGNLLAVGAPSEAGTGAAYLIDIPTQQVIHRFVPEDAAPDDEFGVTVAITGDSVAVGSFGDDDNGFASGSAYLFDSDSGTQTAKLLPSDGSANGIFCWVAFDDGVLLVGAGGADATYGFVLDDRCLADTNGNGIADPGDFTAWIAAYNAGDLIADQNANGVLDPGDFSAWVANYNAGC